MISRSPSLVSVALILAAVGATLACSADKDTQDRGAAFETVLALRPSTWFEDAWRYFEVSPDATLAVYGPRFGVELLALGDRYQTPLPIPGELVQARLARFTPSGDIYWYGTAGGELGWYTERAGGLAPAGVPPFGGLRISPDGKAYAYFDDANQSLVVGSRDSEVAPETFPLGGMPSALAWSPEGRVLYVVVWNNDGTSSLVQVVTAEGTAKILREDLDAVWRFGLFTVSADGRSLYLALAGDIPPIIEARHQPGPVRDLDIYHLDLVKDTVTAVVKGPGDDFNPQIIGDDLYWTHNRIRESVVALPIDGGKAHTVAEDAEIPYWSPDGRQIGVTYGGWRLADWALNLDGGVIDIDEKARATSGITPFVVGYHEDFSPVWSPDGRWIAYHSHRSREPVSYYDAEGSTDSIYLRRPEAPAETETSLFDFGWEVGNADWSPDGRQLVFDSWNREKPGISWPWIVTIDPETGAALRVERLPLPDEISHVSLSAWSPDGREIAVVERLEGTRQVIWILDLQSGGAERLLEFNASTYGGIDWTPDGKSLIYGALAGDRMQVFSAPRSGGEPNQLSHDGANLMHPQVSPDGLWIACTRMDQVKELRRKPLR